MNIQKMNVFDVMPKGPIESSKSYMKTEITKGNTVSEEMNELKKVKDENKGMRIDTKA